MFFVETIAIPGLGNRHYLAGGATTAVAVDPPRDIDQVIAAPARRGVRIALVVETHIHNDYVTGGLELARVTGAEYLVPAGARVSLPRTPVHDGDSASVDQGLTLHAVATPGHTPHHTAYVLHEAGTPVAAFTGGSRHRVAFAEGHAPGTYNFEADGQLATYLAWLIPWGKPVTLLAESPAQLAEAQRELVRVGIDRPAAAATGGPADWLPPGATPASFRRATFAELARERPAAVLDVRRDSERSGRRIEGSLHVPLHTLAGRLGELPEGPVWVHCAGGMRAAGAASLLDAAGLEAVAVDDSLDHAEAAGLTVT
ncbi:rhodanese-like domain-containing protein [Streptomyces albidoflavus]|uniref:rhodanese-like domain-containing protein n=1 Tax=Streptomyces albidoflavus TaxID=1886 RepID=UPI00188C3336|nr:rhodanese-like domain-containing protein [Streptomyces albidoflavus]MBF4137791.1 hypothetical protein [Streptomyces albidoflavus]